MIARLDRWSDDLEERHPFAYPFAVFCVFALLIVFGLWVAAR